MQLWFLFPHSTEEWGLLGVNSDPTWKELSQWGAYYCLIYTPSNGVRRGNFLPGILGGTTKDGGLTYNLTSPVGGALRNNSQEMLLSPAWPFLRPAWRSPAHIFSTPSAGIQTRLIKMLVISGAKVLENKTIFFLPHGLSYHYGEIPSQQWQGQMGLCNGGEKLFKLLLMSIKERSFDLWNSQRGSLIFLKLIYFRFLQISFL